MGSLPGKEGADPLQMRDATSNVAKVDPNTLKVEELVRYSNSDVFSVGTVAVQIGAELWVGSVRGERIAIFPLVRTGRRQRHKSSDANGRSPECQHCSSELY